MLLALMKKKIQMYCCPFRGALRTPLSFVPLLGTFRILLLYWFSSMHLISYSYWFTLYRIRILSDYYLRLTFYIFSNYCTTLPLCKNCHFWTKKFSPALSFGSLRVVYTLQYLDGVTWFTVVELILQASINVYNFFGRSCVVVTWANTCKLFSS